MRRTFSREVCKLAGDNKNIVLITGDVGYGMWDKFREMFPDRFYNAGASEQLMLGAAIGLAISGKIPIVYTITPFLLFRPFEFIRNYVNHEKINVKLVGSGRNNDYAKDGFSHWAGDDKKFMENFENIKIYYPRYKEEIVDDLPSMLLNTSPCYINLER